MDPETFEKRQKNFEEFKQRQDREKAQLVAKKLRNHSAGSCSLGRKEMTTKPKAANLPWTMTKEEWGAKVKKCSSNESQGGMSEEVKLE